MPKVSTDSSEANTIRPPPSSVCNVNSPVPNSTDETLAKTTSDSMMSEVALALRCAAPYCSDRLPARKAKLMSSASPAQSSAGAGSEAMSASQRSRGQFFRGEPLPG